MGGVVTTSSFPPQGAAGVSSADILDDSIMNADINSAAAIAFSKLASSTDISTSGTVTDLTITSEAQGDILYFNGTNWVRLAAGTSGQFLKTLGAAANPAWDNVASSTQFFVTSSSTDAVGGTFTSTTATTVRTITFTPNSVNNVIVGIKVTASSKTSVGTNWVGIRINETQSGWYSSTTNGTQSSTYTPWSTQSTTLVPVTAYFIPIQVLKEDTGNWQAWDKNAMLGQSSYVFQVQGYVNTGGETGTVDDITITLYYLDTGATAGSFGAWS